MKISADNEERHAYYRELFKTSIPEVDVHQIRSGIEKNYPTGNKRFRQQVESAIGRMLGDGRRGRPKKMIKK